MKSKILLIAICITFRLFYTASFAFSARYEVIDLGTLEGHNRSEAYSINNNSQIVGKSSYPHVAVLWENGSIIDLGAGEASGAYDINDNGNIVGYKDGARIAVLWKDGQIIDLGNLGTANIQANGINNYDQIVGEAVTDAGLRTFLWEDGTMTDLLGPLSNYINAAEDINDYNQVVGYNKDHADNWSAYLWEEEPLKRIIEFDLGGPQSFAYAINNKGQVVGYSEIPDGNPGDSHAFLWENGTINDLGTLGGNKGEAYGINEKGVVVGCSRTSKEKLHAFIYDGKIRDLNDLIQNPDWVLILARDINDKGQIVGWGEIGGEIHAFLLNRIQVNRVKVPSAAIQLLLLN